jgi:ribonuclease D
LNNEKPTEFTYVADDSQLGECLEKLRDEPVFAIDMEADSFHHYYPKVCLLQITAGDFHFIVDTLAGVDVRALLAALAPKPLILHDAGSDLRMLKADFDFCPRNRIIDTMLAAKLLGHERVGLSAMLQEYFGLDISKHNQRADWSRRPLDPRLLAYAVEDTCRLPKLWEILKAALERKGRLDWHRQYCEFSTQNALEADLTKDANEERWRIRGVQKLDSRQMAFFRELWLWREDEARKVDLPPFRIFESTRLMELAVLTSEGKTTRRDIDPLLPRTCRGRRLDAMRKAIQKASSLAPSQWPLPKKGDVSKKLSARQIRRIDRLKEECTRIGAELELPSQMIASRSALEWIVKTRALDPEKWIEKRILMPWQADLLRPAVEKILTED